MTRSARIRFPGALYRVIVRQKQPLFKDNENYRDSELLLGEVEMGQSAPIRLCRDA